GLRRLLHAAGAADGQVRRRGGPLAGVRGDREGRGPGRAGAAGVLQRPRPRAAVAVPRRGVDQAMSPLLNTPNRTGRSISRIGMVRYGRLLSSGRVERPLKASVSLGCDEWVMKRSD